MRILSRKHFGKFSYRIRLFRGHLWWKKEEIWVHDGQEWVEQRSKRIAKDSEARMLNTIRAWRN